VSGADYRLSIFLRIFKTVPGGNHGFGRSSDFSSPAIFSVQADGTPVSNALKDPFLLPLFTSGGSNLCDGKRLGFLLHRFFPPHLLVLFSFFLLSTLLVLQELGNLSIFPFHFPIPNFLTQSSPTILPSLRLLSIILISLPPPFLHTWTTPLLRPLHPLL